MKKGFTLVELLAIIVILGIIAIIATPIINDLIENARKNTFKSSDLKLVEVAKQYYLNSKLNGEWGYDGVWFYATDGKFISEKGDELTFNGEMPSDGSKVWITRDGEVLMAIHNEKWCARYPGDGDYTTVDILEYEERTCCIAL